MNIEKCRLWIYSFLRTAKEYLTPLTYKLINIFIIALGILTFITAYGKNIQLNSIKLNNLWLDYSEKEVEKNKAIGEITRHFGYVGVIHYFKNYVLRLDARYYDWAQESLEKTDRAIEIYNSLETNEEARKQMALFKQTVDSYRKKLSIVKELIKKGYTPEKIDQIVIVDDTAARQALKHLIMARNLSTSRAEEIARKEEEHYAQKILYGFFTIIACIIGGVIYLVIVTVQISKEYKESTLLFQSVPNAIIVADSNGFIIRSNLKAQEVFGYSEKEFQTRKIEDLVPRRSKRKNDNDSADIRDKDQTEPITRSNSPFAAMKKDKTVFPAEITIAAYDVGFSRRNIAIIKDLTMEQNLKTEASTDHLTSLTNRKQGERVLSKSIRYAILKKKPLSLIMCDIDHFKKINDNYGHTKGDEILISVATGIAGLVRKTDLVMRWGGEEFLIVCPGLKVKESLKRAEKIRKNIEGRFRKKDPKVTISLGVTELNPDSDTLQTFFHRTDQALYEAKNNGRNQSRML